MTAPSATRAIEWAPSRPNLPLQSRD